MYSQEDEEVANIQWRRCGWTAAIATIEGFALSRMEGWEGHDGGRQSAENKMRQDMTPASIVMPLPIWRNSLDVGSENA